MDLSWETVKISGHPSSVNVDVDSSRDSNVGVRVRTVELPIRPGSGIAGVSDCRWWSVG
jgi:hypothetical protein